MITLYGPQDSNEYEAALRLRNLISQEWPEVVQDPRHNISIVTSVKCYNQSVVDIDLVLFIHLWKPLPTHISYKPNNDEDEHTVYTQYLCVTFECKAHSVDKIIFEGNRVNVKYPGRDHDASEQSFRQQGSLRDYLKSNGLRSPWIFNLVWLTSVLERDLPDIDHNIIAGDSGWKQIIQTIYDKKGCRQNKLTNLYEIFVGHDFHPSYISQACSALTRESEKSPLDRKRIEIITRRIIKEQRYGDLLGSQLLVFRGRGGTGKTVRLLQIAYHIYEEFDGKVLLLTYNHALVSDIKRILGLMGVNQAFSERCITIKTIHSFMGKVINEFGIQEEKENFFGNYNEYKNILIDYINTKTLTSDDIQRSIHHDPENFYWDYILIDESQDWPKDERDILFFMYSYQKFVIADGVDQFVRSNDSIDWRHNIPRNNTQVVPLRQSLRLKDGLCRFLHAFAKQVGIEDWDVESNPDVYGGNIIIIEGQYSISRANHEKIISQHMDKGNKSIDMLYCVPPILASTSKRNPELSRVGAKLDEWEHKIWDGTIDAIRENSLPTLDQIRIIQYDSCRGLEGWTVVNLSFDNLYDYKYEQFDLNDIKNPDLYTSPEEYAHNYAARWLMIPLTRAIDTLVIQISSSNHVVTNALRAAAELCQDIVEWRVISETI